MDGVMDGVMAVSEACRTNHRPSGIAPTRGAEPASAPTGVMT